MSQTIRIPDSVYERAVELADEKDMSRKEAVRYMCNTRKNFEV